MKKIIDFYYKNKICINSFGILLLSGVLRVFFGESVLSRDGYYYCNLAEFWHEQGFIPSYINNIPLGVVYIYKTFLTYGLPVVESAITYNLILSSFLPVIVYLIAEKCFQDHLIAVWSGILMSFNPYLLETSWQTMRDTTYLFFSGLAFCVLFCYPLKNRVLNLFVFSLFCSFALLARHEAVELFVLLLWYVWKQRDEAAVWKGVLRDVFLSVAFLGILLVAENYLMETLDVYFSM